MLKVVRTFIRMQLSPLIFLLSSVGFRGAVSREVLTLPSLDQKFPALLFSDEYCLSVLKMELPPNNCLLASGAL